MTEKAKMTIDNLVCEKVEKKTVESDKGEIVTYKYTMEGDETLTISTHHPLSITHGQEFTAKFHDPQSTLEDHEGDE